jgi:hypothetical protein
MRVHLLDGTYELFRHFHGRRRFAQGKDAPFGAVAGVLHTGAGDDRCAPGRAASGDPARLGSDEAEDLLWPCSTRSMIL